MNTVLKDNLDVFATVYLDNILVFSRNPEEHESSHPLGVVAATQQPSACKMQKVSLRA